MRNTALAALLALPAPLSAHPHVFADSRIEVVMDGTLVTAIRLTWTYDEFFSLLLAEDLGLDPDADAVLTPAELATLSASVTAWPEDFGGDLVVSQGEEPLPLAPRRDHAIDWREGRLVETHLRPLAAPVDARAAAVTIENYDPYYYVAYAVQPDVVVTGGETCEARHHPADPVAGQAIVDGMFEDLDIAGAGPEEELPPVGFAFADRVEVRCAS